jgi:hypothetical protein
MSVKVLPNKFVYSVALGKTAPRQIKTSISNTYAYLGSPTLGIYYKSAAPVVTTQPLGVNDSIIYTCGDPLYWPQVSTLVNLNKSTTGIYCFQQGISDDVNLAVVKLGANSNAEIQTNPIHVAPGDVIYQGNPIMMSLDGSNKTMTDGMTSNCPSGQTTVCPSDGQGNGLYQGLTTNPSPNTINSLFKTLYRSLPDGMNPDASYMKVGDDQGLIHSDVPPGTVVYYGEQAGPWFKAISSGGQPCNSTIYGEPNPDVTIDTVAHPKACWAIVEGKTPNWCNINVVNGYLDTTTKTCATCPSGTVPNSSLTGCIVAPPVPTVIVGSTFPSSSSSTTTTTTTTNSASNPQTTSQPTTVVGTPPPITGTSGSTSQNYKPGQCNINIDCQDPHLPVCNTLTGVCESCPANAPWSSNGTCKTCPTDRILTPIEMNGLSICGKCPSMTGHPQGDDIKCSQCTWYQGHIPATPTTDEQPELCVICGTDKPFYMESLHECVTCVNDSSCPADQFCNGDGGCVTCQTLHKWNATTKVCELNWEFLIPIIFVGLAILIGMFLFLKAKFMHKK